jgi:predicted permease
LPSDLRYALRTLRKSPRFSVIAILVLGLGIGANTAMFSVVYNVLLRPLNYPQPGQLVFLQESSLRGGGLSPTAPATYADWRDQQSVFQAMAAAEVWGATLTGSGRPEELAGLKVSTSLLSVLRAAPILGRGFADGDERVALVSYPLWQRRFAGDASIVGTDLILNGANYRVIGVMPNDFRFPPFWAEKTELWVPLVFSPARSHSRDGRSLRVFARLKEGITLERAAAEMGTIANRIALAHPDTNKDRGVRVMALSERVVGDVRRALVVLLGAVLFLLLIACANVASLLLGRAMGRRKEIAVRLAVGARRWHLVRQLTVESLVLSFAGGAVGMVLAVWLLRALAASITEGSRFVLPRYQEIGVGGAVLAFTFVVSAASGILFALVPALQSSRHDMSADFKAARTSARDVLVAGEIAVSLVLLAGAALMIRSLARLGAIDPGFDGSNVLTMRVVLTGSPHAAAGRRTQFYQQIIERVKTVPGVVSASGINHLPLAGDLWTLSFTVDGRPLPPPQERPGAAFRVVFPDYFATMRIPLLRGRDFTARDDGAAPRVTVINQTMARRYWPGEDPVGKRIRFGGNEPFTVIGVVKDVEQHDWGGVADNEFYFTQPQNPEDIQSYLTLVARTGGDPHALAEAVRSSVWSLDRDLPITDVASMQQVVDRAVWQPRFSTTLLAGFAGLAVTLAAIGIYGVISFEVSRRTREIGIRMALGAKPADVLRSVLGDGVKMSLAGTAIGGAGALLLTRYLQDLLYGVTATDPLSLGAAAVGLGVLALGAMWLPARRATRVDPSVALRDV